MRRVLERGRRRLSSPRAQRVGVTLDHRPLRQVDVRAPRPPFQGRGLGNAEIAGLARVRSKAVDAHAGHRGMPANGREMTMHLGNDGSDHPFAASPVTYTMVTVNCNHKERLTKQ